jgi:hypothetical protein
MTDDAWSRKMARDEARSLMNLLKTGSSTAELRRLIAVDPKTEQWLCAFVKENPGDTLWIEAALKFRQGVLEVFDALVSDGIPVNQSAEAKETERGPLSEAQEIAACV